MTQHFYSQYVSKLSLDFCCTLRVSAKLTKNARQFQKVSTGAIEKLVRSIYNLTEESAYYSLGTSKKRPRAAEFR